MFSKLTTKLVFLTALTTGTIMLSASETVAAVMHYSIMGTSINDNTTSTLTGKFTLNEDMTSLSWKNLDISNGSFSVSPTSPEVNFPIAQLPMEVGQKNNYENYFPTLNLPIFGMGIWNKPNGFSGMVTKVPEPMSILGLLAFGTLGVASTFKRQLKSSKSTEKELEKAS